MDKTFAQTPDKPLPLISIIMPTHNAGRYIGQAIQSVLDQTYPHWELIIVDDASSDNTSVIVDELIAAHPEVRIRYHRSERIGHPAGVRNAGLRMASGELIAFLDSDDLYFADTLEKLSRPLLQNPELSAVYGFAFNMDEHGNPLPQTVPLIPNENPQPGEPAYHLPPGFGHSWENIVTSNISCLLAGLVLRRSAWEQIGFFNENLCGPEDYEFYVRMYLHDYEGVHCLSDYVYQYRIHSASLTKAPEHVDRLLSSCLKIMHWMFTEAPIPAQVRSLKSAAYVACYRYLARERLMHGQPYLTRQIVTKAWQDRNIAKRDALIQCGPLWLRSWLPANLDSQLVRLRAKVRHCRNRQQITSKAVPTP